MLRLIALVLAPLALVTGAAAAALGGPSPGVMTGWDGTVDGSGTVRYVALPGAGSTAVAAVRMTDGRVLRYTMIRGALGIPMVAFDGTTEGVSRDGKMLVLADAGAGQATRFAVLRTAPLRLKKSFTLPGRWSYDALSPDARTMYAIQYASTGPNPRYNVRAVSLVTGKPIGGAIVDKREPDEEMNGSPWSRARSSDAAWAYTLYAKPDGTAFVHALDTAHRRAFCVDLPWRSTPEAISGVRLALESEGRALVLSKPGLGKLAIVDTQSLKVESLAKP
jgi:hypothetical protein